MVVYRAAKVRFDEDEGFKTRSREAVTKLQSGDPESLAAWGRICQASRLEFAALYKRLGVTVEVWLASCCMESGLQHNAGHGNQR